MLAHVCPHVPRNAPFADATAAAWNVLWPSGKLRTRDFHVFAMEMLADMDTELIRSVGLPLMVKMCVLSQMQFRGIRPRDCEPAKTSVLMN